MLNGIDPVIIFTFYKRVDVAMLNGPLKNPVVSQVPNLVLQSVIPIYLSEQLTGLFIDTESKNLDIQTSVETKSDGSTPDIAQKGLNASVTVNLKGHRDSIGLALFSALSDMAFKKLTSKEYGITYLHGATTIFNGVFQGFSASQNADDTLLSLSFELSIGTKAPEAPTEKVVVPEVVGTLPS